MSEENETKRLKDALDYAIEVIESYEMDIRSKPELVAEGFCQGRIYRNALDVIKQKAGIDESF